MDPYIEACGLWGDFHHGLISEIQNALARSAPERLLLGDASLVEIDLLCGGERMPMLDPWPDSPYTLLVARAKKYDLCRVWPVYFQIASPAVPVPLAKPDPDILLDLQPMIDSIYRRSRYERSIDYSKPLSPALDDVASTWLGKQLRAERGRR